MSTIFEVTIKSRYFQQECLNVMHYLWNGEGSDTVGQASALVAAMGWTGWTIADNYPADSFAEAWQSISHTSVIFESVLARNIYSSTDFYEWLFLLGGSSNAGTAVGTAASPAFAYGFKSSKTRFDIKRGARRMVGVSETNMEAGGVLSAGAMTVLDDVAVKFGAIYDAGEGNTFSPAICKKNRVPVLDGEGEPTGRFKYVFFTDPAVQVANSAFPVTWQAVNTARTQTSRQYGRGR